MSLLFWVEPLFLRSCLKKRSVLQMTGTAGEKGTGNGSGQTVSLDWILSVHYPSSDVGLARNFTNRLQFVRLYRIHPAEKMRNNPRGDGKNRKK